MQGLALENCPYCDATYLHVIFAAEVEGNVGRQTVFWVQEGHCKLSWPGEEHRTACHPFLPAFLFFLFSFILNPWSLECMCETLECSPGTTWSLSPSTTGCGLGLLEHTSPSVTALL